MIMDCHPTWYLERNSHPIRLQRYILHSSHPLVSNNDKNNNTNDIVQNCSRCSKQSPQPKHCITSLICISFRDVEDHSQAYLSGLNATAVGLRQAAARQKRRRSKRVQMRRTFLKSECAKNTSRLKGLVSRRVPEALIIVHKVLC